MRIQQLDLIRYGKFDGASIAFPKAAHDFHVIVGPNEAGKSTVRQAISEWLFGMPQRTRLDFRHALTELRLGGTVQDAAAGELRFHRTRGRTPLRSPEDERLADDALAPWLRGASKAFFEQMFGLDHGQLLEGGRSILDSSSDVGRILFQSAAGIGSLGPVREALEQRAADLWTPRGTRSEYAAAARALAEAGDELRKVQVRTTAWTAARAALQEVDDGIEEQEKRRAVLDARRSQLERVRRLAPVLLKLRERQDALRALADTPELPEGALAELSDGERELAAARTLLEERGAALAARREERAAIGFDASVLALDSDIEALEALRSRCADHPQELALLQAEVTRLASDLHAAARQLGWPTDEQALRSAQPGGLALRTVGKLLADRGALFGARQGAAGVLAERQREQVDLQMELRGQVATDVPPALRQALEDAQALRNSPSRQRALRQQSEQAGLEVDQALAALGRWKHPVQVLRDMALPMPARLARQQRQRHEVAAAFEQEQEQHRQAHTAWQRLVLQERQFVSGRKLVTPTEVQQARADRDSAWARVRSGAVALDLGAPTVDAAIRLSDELADARLGSATDAATLQLLREQIELAAAELARLQSQLATRRSELEDLDRQWSDWAASAGLPGMALDDMPDWLQGRDAVFAAVRVRQDLQRELDAEVANCLVAAQALTNALPGLRSSQDLAGLCAEAATFLQAADAAVVRRQGLDQQLRAAHRAVDSAQAVSDAAQSACDRWLAEWQSALQAARLAGASTGFAEAASAVEIATAVADRLRDLDALRAGRIAVLQSELAALGDAAARLSKLLPSQAPEQAVDTAKRLSLQLREARVAEQKARSADQALQAATELEAEALLRSHEAQARLAPLLRLAGTQSVAEALPLIQRSDARRALQREVAAATDALAEGGDGLDRAAIEAEVAAQDPTLVVGLLEEARQELDDVNARLAELLQRRVSAGQAFGAIAGQADAANAESRRQEALSTLGDVAEQYMETATAARLLKWATDRYRDRKQGPMLQRASTVFAGLTLGDFTRLVVDYEKDVPTLQARRSAGPLVEVGGLSEGTRDQLFLALRIAALELHLEHASALPFIADDLLINWDDSRSLAGLRALRALSTRTQVIFLTHHHHLLPIVREVFGADAHVTELRRETT